jgi:hypothetical protein
MEYQDQVVAEPMKNGVFAGRYTAQMEDSFIVFLIGMRVNRVWDFKKWVPTAMAMPPMLQELFAHGEEKGFLGGEMFFRFGPLTTMMVTYWRPRGKSSTRMSGMMAASGFITRRM